MDPSIYTSLSTSEGIFQIRLLRLLASEFEDAPICCSLFVYTLNDLGERPHLYEALSYVWGDASDTKEIKIAGCPINVTANLYAALRHLRNHHFDRILWVDALCIDQSNEEEVATQILMMAQIYSHGVRVIVWLGEEADDSDEALHNICSAVRGDRSMIDPLDNKLHKLLARPWFTRVWVLQEVASARQVRIMCGLQDTDSFVFCSGLQKLSTQAVSSRLQKTARTSADRVPAARSVQPVAADVAASNSLLPGYDARILHPVIHLKSQSSYRLKRSSLKSYRLGELLDLYHGYKATKRHDKVYALLGMSSDVPSTSALSPDYNLSWDKLINRVITHILGTSVETLTWPERDVILINGQIRILGPVLSITAHERGAGNGYKFSFQAFDSAETFSSFVVSAKSVKQADIVCCFRGSQFATIIRPHGDYFEVIAITSALQSESRADRPVRSWFGVSVLWDWETANTGHKNVHGRKVPSSALYKRRLKNDSEHPEPKNLPATEIAILYYWVKHHGASKAKINLQELYSSRFADHKSLSCETLEMLVSAYDHSDQFDLCATACAVGEKISETQSGRTVWQILWQGMRWKGRRPTDGAVFARWQYLMLILRNKPVSSRDEELLSKSKGWPSEDLPLIFEKRVNPFYESQHTLTRLVRYAKRFPDQIDDMAELLELHDGHIKFVDAEVLLQVAAEQEKERTFGLILEKAGPDFKPVKKVLEAKIRVRGHHQLERLLNDCGEEVVVTNAMLEAVIGTGDHYLFRLLQRFPQERFDVTESILEVAAANKHEYVLKLLLVMCEPDVRITRTAFEAASRGTKAYEKLQLLFQHGLKHSDLDNETIYAIIQRSYLSQAIILLMLRYKVIESEAAAEMLSEAAERLADTPFVSVGEGLRDLKKSPIERETHHFLGTYIRGVFSALSTESQENPDTNPNSAENLRQQSRLYYLLRSAKII